MYTILSDIPSIMFFCGIVLSSVHSFGYELLHFPLKWKTLLFPAFLGFIGLTQLIGALTHPLPPLLLWFAYPFATWYLAFAVNQFWRKYHPPVQT